MGSKNKNKNKDKGGAVVSGDGGQGSGSKQGDGRNRGNIITDARFASLHSDPRFMEAPKNKAKVAIDSRFNSMFTDKNFASSQARIDKRGKPKKDSGDEFLKHYYRLEDEEEEERARKIERIEQLFKDEETGGGEESEELMSEDDESESSGSEVSEEDKRKKKNLNVKNESEESESEVGSGDDSSSSTSDEDEDEEDAELYEEEEEGALAQEENIPDIDKETHRLAVVNMDWSQVKAVDLYVLLSSFLPKNGQIKSVSVYPSEFGLKRMEEEALHGPVGLFDEDQHKNVEDEDDDDDDEIDNEKLRAYEISRLRYYYAVVECDSVATADYLYNNCDGVEFERSSTKLDLRFIPDSMEFKHQPRDVATEAPADFEGADFHTRALQHSKIQLTWDEDEPQRAKTLKRKLNTDQLAELELKEFLASDESESNDSSDEDVPQDMPSKKQKKQELYRALLQSGDGSEENDQDEDEKKDMEVTFSTGLEDLSKRILEKKDRKSESVWDAYLRKRREKKRNRKNRSKNSSEDESSDTDNEPADEPDDFFIEESHTNGSKKNKNKNSKKEKQDDEMAQETEASRAELELLLADDKGTDANLKGYNLKRKKLKGKRGKEAPDEGKLPSVDYEDPRFSALFNSPLFALDPTDPQFKRSAAYARQMAQKQQKGERENMGTIEKTNDESRTVKDGSEPNELPSKKEKHELSSLVKSIKMKSKQVSNNGTSSKESKQKHAKAR